MTTNFKPMHINATSDDLAGNDGIGRYIFLSVSDGRAEEIAKHFENLSIKPHRGGHNIYLGSLLCDGKSIDVAAVATGTGCPSAEIMMHELFHLGGKRFLRVGTAGSLQSQNVKLGELVNAQASVRDEDTSIRYAPAEFPAIASLEFASSIMLAAGIIGLAEQLHTGIVHCKSSFYAREFGAGPRAEENKAYIQLLKETGVLASEMESSTIFVQSQIYNHKLQIEGVSPQHRVLAGAILAIVTSPEEDENTEKSLSAIKNSIDLAIEAVKVLARQELIG